MAVRSTTNADYLTGTSPTGSFTVITWFKIDTTPGTGTFLGIWSIDNNVARFIEPYFDGDLGRLSHGFDHGGGDLAIDTSPSANTWYWLASVCQVGAPGIVYWAKGGRRLTKLTDGVGNIAGIPDTTIYLFNESALDETPSGDLAGFMLYDRLLTEPEILAQYSQLAPISRNGLRYYLPMNARQAPQLKQLGYGSNFTLHGTLGFTSQMPPVPEIASSRNPVTRRLNSVGSTTFDRIVSDGIVTVVTF